MRYMQFSYCLALMITMMTFALASRHGGKIHFHDSSDLGELGIDERSVNGHGHRNHRGRGRHHHHHQQHYEGNMAVLEETLPQLYPIKGPAQPPLILSTHPGRGFQTPLTNTSLPLQLPAEQAPPLNDQRPIFFTQPPPVPPSQQNAYDQKPIFATQPQPVPQNPYDANPFLANLQTPSVITTNKYNPTISQGVTNQLPTSDKPVTTTTPSYLNPRRTDLMYGSNLLEEEANREGKSSGQTEITFEDRGLFDTAPHCKTGQILVNNRCRLAV